MEGNTMVKTIGIMLGAVSGGLLGFITSAVFNWFEPSALWLIGALILTTFGCVYAAFVAGLLVFVDENLDMSFLKLLAAGFGCSNVVYLAMVVLDIGFNKQTAGPDYFAPGSLLGVALLGITTALGFYLGSRTIPRWLENR
jgi:hypothetical protein